MRVLVALSWLALILAPEVLLSQETALVGEYLGSSGCFDCHEVPSPAAKERGSTEFIQLTEAKNWVFKDKHARAFTNVRDTDLGKQILKILGIEKLALAGQCTSCHSNPYWLKTNGGVEDARIVYKESGVTCETCHGASSLWDTKHRSVSWRAESPEIKAGLGMSDIRNPVTRAKICFSCHIGDVSQNRMVTHEMYAAGHPPLPSIELETFLEKMPRHWRTVEEKKMKPKEGSTDATAKERFTNATAFFEVNGISESKYRRLESVILSSAVAFRTSVKLIEQQVEKSNKPGGPAWPELALFDCYGCHHDLKIPSWRQVRANEVPGYKLRPGRPQLLYWPTTLLPLSGQKLDGVNASLREVGQALDRRPFGDPAVVGLAAGKVAAQVDDLVRSIKDVSLEKGDDVEALKQLCAQAESPTVDYESARQIGWAFTIILQAYPPENHAAFKEPIEQLEVQLKLNLPWGQEEKIDEQLPAALKAASDYEPEEFRAIMRGLGKLLGQESGS
jgi:hypothetical protein